MTMNEPRTRRGDQAGITLIEMLVVMTIIALFAALVAPNMLKHTDTARVTKARGDIHGFMTALATAKFLSRETRPILCFRPMAPSYFTASSRSSQTNSITTGTSEKSWWPT